MGSGGEKITHVSNDTFMEEKSCAASMVRARGMANVVPVLSPPLMEPGDRHHLFFAEPSPHTITSEFALLW